MKKTDDSKIYTISVRERIRQVDVQEAQEYVQKAIDDVNQLFSLNEQREYDFAAVIDIINQKKTLSESDKDRIYYHFLSFKRHNI